MTDEAARGERRPRWEGAGARLRADAPLVVGVLVVFALAFAGLHTVLQGWGWWWWALALTVVSLGVGLAASALRLGRVLSPLAVLVALAVLVVARFGAGTAVLGIVPTAESFEVFRRLVRDSTYSITWQTVPARADEPIMFVLTLGVVVLLVLTHVAVFSLGAPALAGVLVAAVFVVPTIPPEGEWSRPVFIATAVAFLGLLLIRPVRRSRGRGRWRASRILHPRALAVVSGVAVSAVVAGLVVPAALPSTDVAVTSSELGPAVATGANPILRLGEDLRRNEALPVLTYSTVSGDGMYLRLSEIADFAGETWGAQRPVLEESNRPADFPRPPGLDRGVSTQRDVAFVHVGNLQSPWLPVPYAASRIVGLQGEWRWVPGSLTVASNGSLAAGEDFTVESVRVVPTPQQLRAAGSSVPEGMERYLELPDVPDPVVAAAREFTAGAGSSYERAVALQQALRSSPFRYSEDAPVVDGYDATNLGAIEAFLDAGAGYCIHFASAMATMARVLGIPSRVIVGFQPGSREHGLDAGRTLFSVTTHDLHAWPELYFEGLGWVAFEPTPSRGSLPAYANPAVVGVPDVSPVPAGPAGPVDAGEPTLPQIDDRPVEVGWLTTVDYRAWLALGVVALLVAALVLGPAAVRGVVRSRRVSRVRAGRGSPALAWREVLDTALDAGVDVAAGSTPRAVVARLSRARGMTEDARAALERLCAALEVAEFGPPGGAPLGDGSALADDLELVVASLLGGLDSGDRVRARLLSPALVADARNRFLRRA